MATTSADGVQRGTGKEQVVVPGKKETVDDLLTSLESKLQDDEAAWLLVKLKRTLEKNQEQHFRLESQVKELQEQLHSAQQYGQRLYKQLKHLQKEEDRRREEWTHVGHPHAQQLQDELTSARSSREGDRKEIEKHKKKANKQKAHTADQKKVVDDASKKPAKRHVKQALLDGVFGGGIEAAGAEKLTIDLEKAHNKIKMLQKEVEEKDSHMEKMSQKILNIKKEKEILEQKVATLSSAKDTQKFEDKLQEKKARIAELANKISKLQNELTTAREDKVTLQTYVTQLKAELPSAKLEKFQVLEDELLSRKLTTEDLRQQVADYETMIKDYSSRYCKELGEAAVTQNEKQRRIEQLEADIKQLNDELEFAKIQNQVFEDNFNQERKDREHAHSLIADKEKELQTALVHNKKLRRNLSMMEESLQQYQEQQSSSQKETEGWRPFRLLRMQLLTGSRQVEELERERDTAYQQVNSYKTQTELYKKELEGEKKRTRQLERQMEMPRTNPISSAMEADAGGKYHILTHDLYQTKEQLKDTTAECTTLRSECTSLRSECTRLSAECSKLKKQTKILWKQLRSGANIDGVQLPVEPLPPKILSEGYGIPMAGGAVGDAARPAQGRHEEYRGEIGQAGQSRVPLSPTEEQRRHAAFQERLHAHENSQGRPEWGSEVEMQMHAKNAAPTTGEQLSTTLSLPSPAQDSRPLVACQSEGSAQAGSSNSEQVVPGGSKYSASSPGDFIDGKHRQYGTNDVAREPEPEETLVEENKLVAGIDQEIEDTASEVREMVKQPVMTKVQGAVGSYEIPVDPNLVCPKCQKQFKHGEIQKLRLHYHQCKK